MPASGRREGEAGRACKLREGGLLRSTVDQRERLRSRRAQLPGGWAITKSAHWISRRVVRGVLVARRSDGTVPARAPNASAARHHPPDSRGACPCDRHLCPDTVIMPVLASDGQTVLVGVRARLRRAKPYYGRLSLTCPDGGGSITLNTTYYSTPEEAARAWDRCGADACPACSAPGGAAPPARRRRRMRGQQSPLPSRRPPGWRTNATAHSTSSSRPPSGPGWTA